MVKGEVRCRVKQRRLASAECMGKTFTRLLETSEGDDQVMKALKYCSFMVDKIERCGYYKEKCLYPTFDRCSSCAKLYR